MHLEVLLFMDIEALHLALIEQKITLAIAESCTGGALSSAFVKNAGASSYFQGAIVAYATCVKEKLLKIDPALITTFGVVSEEVSRQMALHVAQELSADLGLGVTGNLGPTGEPIGVVCASIAYKGNVVLSWTMHFTGSRLHILERAVQEILSKTYLFVNEKS